ncbi:hypothetical protein PROAA_770013 [Candidatus Propionivibrio aalborgensis]|uniref:Uncharacterized protein n=1 Tax=Candidatus Propionivibrio aalborgensis TaxID=1860101 RepID=A0A1A8Y1Q7_9RHOO|nr:hypothetical protein PROAA_770013 [Candidatus Propionivibrio aalborgensis]
MSIEKGPSAASEASSRAMPRGGGLTPRDGGLTPLGGEFTSRGGMSISLSGKSILGEAAFPKLPKLSHQSSRWNKSAILAHASKALSHAPRDIFAR